MTSYCTIYMTRNTVHEVAAEVSVTETNQKLLDDWHI